MTTLVPPPFAQRLLTIIIFLFIPVSIVAPHGIVWEIIIGGLVSLYYSRNQSLEELPKTIVIILFVIPLWGIVTALWAKFPMASLLMGIKTLTLVLLGIYWCRFMMSLPVTTQNLLIQALIWGLFIGLFFLIGDTWLGNPWQHFWNKTSAKSFSQGSLMISLGAWPAILWVLQRPYPFLGRISLLTGLLFSIFWTLFQIDCDTSFIGLFLGICVFSGTLLLPRLASLGMRLFVPILILSFPLISLYAFKPAYIPVYNSYVHSASYLDRLHIWNDIATTILEHPWRGIGMDGTHSHEKADLTRDWTFVDQNAKSHRIQTTRFGMHPHNAILQLWLELGFPGVILGTLLAYLTLFYIYRTNLLPLERAISAGLFTGIFLIFWVSLGFWQSWWISGLWIIVGLTISMFKNKREANERVYC